MILPTPRDDAPDVGSTCRVGRCVCGTWVVADPRDLEPLVCPECRRGEDADAVRGIWADRAQKIREVRDGLISMREVDRPSLTVAGARWRALIFVGCLGFWAVVLWSCTHA